MNNRPENYFLKAHIKRINKIKETAFHDKQIPRRFPFLHSSIQAMSSERRTVDIIGHVFRVTTNHGFGHAWSRGRTVKGCLWLAVALLFSALLVSSLMTISSWLMDRETRSEVSP